jgi:hypothetical protein
MGRTLSQSGEMMLVDVVRLRRSGAKIPDVETKVASGVRGHLFFESPMRLGRAALHREPYGKGPELLPPLANAVLTKIDGDSMLIVGTETHSLNAIDGKYPQSWWCRLVKDGPCDARGPNPVTEASAERRSFAPA